MATITGVTAERFIALESRMLGLDQEQGDLESNLAANQAILDELNNVTLPALQEDLSLNEANLATLNDVQLPALRLDLEANTASLTNLNDVKIPAMDASLAQADASLANLNDVVIPAMDADLSSNVSAVGTLNNVTIPALNADISTNTTEIATLRDVAIPDLNLELSAHDSRIVAAQTDLDAAETTLTQHASSIGTLNAELDMVGGYATSGVNILDDSARVRGGAGFRGFELPVYPIFKDRVGRKVAISFDMKVNTTAATIFVYAYQGSGISMANTHGGANGGLSFEATTTWKRFKFVTTVTQHTAVPNPTQPRTDGGIYWYDQPNTSGGIHVRNIKIEEGLASTDWASSAADVAADIAEHDLAITTLKTDLDAAEVTLSQHGSSINTLNNVTIPALNADLSTNSTSIDTLNNTTIPGLNSTLSGHNTRITAAQTDLDAAEVTLGQQATLISNLRTDLTSNQQAVSTLNNTTIPGLNSTLSSHDTRITAAQTDLDSAETTIASQASSITSINSTLSSHNTRITAAQTDLDAAEVTLGQHNTRITAAQTDLDAAEATLGQHTTSIDTLNNTTIPGLNSTLSSHNTRITAAQADIDAAEVTLGQHNTRITAAQIDLDAAETTLSSHTSSIGTLNTDLSEAQTTLASQSSSISTINNTLSTHNTRITAAQTDLDAAEVTLASHTTSIGTLNTNLSTANSDISALEGKFPIKAADVGFSVGGGNLVINSSFENTVTPLANWTEFDPSATMVATVEASELYGAKCAKLVNTAAGQNSYLQQVFVDVRPSTSYVLSAWLYVGSITAGAIDNRAILLNDPTGVFAADVTLNASHVLNKWVRKVIRFTTAAGTTSLQARLYGPQGTVWWDGVQLEIGDVATSYAPKPDEILPETIGSNELSIGSVTTVKMTANTINGDRVTANTLNASKIVAGSVTTDRMTANTITGDRITANTLNADKVVAGSITSDRMTANTISGDRILANTLDAAKIVAGSITTDKMTANSISGDRITAGTLNADRLVAGSLVVGGPSSALSFANGFDPTLTTATQGNSGAVIFHNPMVFSQAGANLAGSIVITTPITFNNFMTTIRLKGYNYVANNSEIDATISFYAYTDPASPWYNTAQTSIGSCPVIMRLAKSASGTVAIIVDPVDAIGWQYTKLAVVEAIVGGYPPQTWRSGWSAALATDLTAYTNVITPASRDLDSTNSLTQGWRTPNTTEINGGVITTNTINATKIIAGSITTDRMTANSISGDRITANTLNADKIVAGSITSDRITVNTLTGDRITANTLDAAKIVAGSVTTDRMTANSITGDRITANTLDAAKIVAGSIQTDRMTANSINGDRVTAGTLHANRVVAGSITTDRMTANTISGDRITANTLNADKIIAGSITTDRMTANSISGDRITANTLNADKIVAGSITGDRIAANSITTANLTVASMDNIVEDPTFQLELGSGKPWTSSPTGFSVVPNAGRMINGGMGRALQVVTTTAGQAARAIVNSLKLAEPGQAYRLGMWIKSSVAAPANALQIQLYTARASGTTIAWQTVPTPALLADVWTWVSGMTETTLETVRLGVSLQVQTNAPVGTFWVDYVQATRAANAKLVVDGSISTAHMIANTISGDRITANTLNADKIIAGSITTDRMTANSISGDRITANTLNADKIVANTITADKIAAGAITTEKLTVSSVGDNLIVNGNFWDVTSNGAPQGWTYEAGAITTFLSENSGGSSKYLRVITNETAGPTTDIWQQGLTGTPGLIPARAQEAFHVESGVGSGGGGHIYRLAMHYYDRANVYLGTVYSGSLTTTANEAAYPGRQSAVLTVPSGGHIAYVKFGFTVESPNASYLFDNYVVGKVSVSARIADGAITTPKMIANSITGDRITANTLDAAKIVAGSIQTDRMTANSINGDRVTAGTLHANRVVAGSITSDRMTANTISGDRILANTLNADKIVAGSITTDRMTANSISGDRITAGTLHADKIIAGTIQADRLTFTPATSTDIANVSAYASSGINLIPNAYSIVERGGARFIEQPTYDYLKDYVGQKIAVSFEMKVATPAPINVYPYQNSGISIAGGGIFNATTEWQRFSFTTTVHQWSVGSLGAGYTTGGIGHYDFSAITGPTNQVRLRNYKVELGLAATPWTPSPGDVQGVGNLTSSWTYAGSTDITGAKIRTGTIEATKIIAGSITTDRMTANTISGDRILANTLNADKIVAGSITTDRITVNTLTGDRITANTLDAAKIVAGSIATDRMTANSISGDRITANTLDAAKIVAGSIATDRMTANSISGDRITANTLDAAKIVAGSVTAAQIAARSISASEIVARTLTANEIVARTLTANEIVARTIGANEITANSIGANEITANSIGAGQIVANSIGAGQIAANSIGAGQITANSIGANEIVANSIGADQIAANSINAGHIVSTAIDGKTITGAILQTAYPGSHRLQIMHDYSDGTYTGILRWYNTSGNPVGYVYSHTGGLVMGYNPFGNCFFSLSSGNIAQGGLSVQSGNLVLSSGYGISFPSGSLSRHKSGSGSYYFGSNGIASIPHGLGVTPSGASAQSYNQSTANLVVTVESMDATYINVRAVTISGTAQVSQSRNITWVATAN